MEDMKDKVELNISNKKSFNSRSTIFYISFVFLVVSTVLCVEVGIYIITAIDMGYAYHEEIASGHVLVDHLSYAWVFFIIIVAVFLISLVIMTVTCGKKNAEGRVELSKHDRTFTDIAIVILIAAVTLGLLSSAVPMYEFLYTEFVLPDLRADGALILDSDLYSWYINPLGPDWTLPLLGVLGTTLCVVIGIYEYCVIVRKIKSNRFWKDFIIGKFLMYINNMIKESSNIFWKIMIVLIGGAVLSASIVGIIPVLIAIFVLVPRQLKKYEKIREGIKEIKNGNLDYKIPVYDRGELDKMAIDINAISDATSKVVENELKSQRMKTDLITNVSHDLKTPLTSMVSYVDLLKKEGLDSENAQEYLRIIDEKTRRLQKLTEDLFDAAKASSGSIPLNMEFLDMSYIVNQALAELDERITASKLDVILNQNTENTRVFADGRQLWRVIENLLVNATKYALEGSRLYIDIYDADDMIKLEMKNISRDQLNIDPAELMQRFKRGDDSRTTEGSGLGLAISKDLVSLMGGIFDIKIDGDLFKAYVLIPKQSHQN